MASARRRDRWACARKQGFLSGTKYHRPKAPEITPEAAGWVVSLACTQPKDHGLAAELWTLSALAGWVRAGAVAAGHGCLHRAAKATIWRILNAHDIKPHRVRYQGKTVLAGLTEQFSDVGARVFGHAQVIEDKPTVAGEALDGRSDAVSCL
jgi:hypothetical protein